MRVRVGTSGFSYAGWRGSFYPEGMKDAEMLAFYAGRFPSVEINNTFYRMPSARVLAQWADATPDGFRFVVKAPRRLTHEKRLADPDGLAYFLKALEALGAKRGPLLFQLPPFFKQDLPRLRGFLAAIPAGVRVALEFRHASWNDAAVMAALREAGAALCTADTDQGEAAPSLVATADWGYLRLRRADYDDAALDAWAARIRAQPWSEAYVFLKHEDEGRAPALAARLAARLSDTAP